MGMFDRIYVNCPKYNYETEVQSKNGDLVINLNIN